MAELEVAMWERRFLVPTIGFPAWSRYAPNRLASVSDESGSFQAHTWDLATGERRRLTEEAVGVISAVPTADGSGVAWFRDETGDESGGWVVTPFEGGPSRQLLPDAPDGWPEGLALGRGVAAAAIADRQGFAVYVSLDGGPAKEVRRDVDLIRIGEQEIGLEGFDRSGLSADESLLCVQAAQDGDNIHLLLRVLDTHTGAVVGELADGSGLALQAFAWSPVPGDARLLIAHEREDLHRPAIWSPRTGERTDLAVDLPGEAFGIDWWPDARSILILHRYRGRDQLLRYEPTTGSTQEIVPASGEIAGAAVRPDGTVWLRTSSGGHASRLLDQDGREIVAPGGPGLTEGRPYRSWSFSNGNGDRVHGFVVVPPGPGPFPIFLRVHGGPSWLYADAWQPGVQMLVDHGIAVGIVNYRGSTGYGAAWRDRIIGNIGFPEVEDTVAGLDDLVARGIADPQRAAIGGWSWGGYVTLLAAGLESHRWRCAVAGVPVGDYLESYDDSAPSLQAYDRSLIGGVVHDLPEYVEKISPISYVEKVRCPILFLIADNDTRCVPKQAMNYVDAFRANGGAAEVYAYGTGHSSFVVDEEIRQHRAVLEFVLRHLGLPGPD
jgi:dipeptidyl aminopeptidase/acylaminoacyl peptidase